MLEISFLIPRCHNNILSYVSLTVMWHSLLMRCPIITRWVNMQPRLVRQFCSESSCATHPAFATKKGLILLRPSISPPCEDSGGNFCAWSGSFGRPQRRMRLSMDGYLGFTGVGDSDFLRRCCGLSAPPIVCPPAPILLCCFGV